MFLTKFYISHHTKLFNNKKEFLEELWKEYHTDNIFKYNKPENCIEHITYFKDNLILEILWNEKIDFHINLINFNVIKEEHIVDDNYNLYENIEKSYGNFLLPEDIKEIHIESSSYCNLLCPGCGRQENGVLRKDIIQTHISEIVIKRILELNNNLRHIYFCGNYGDPLMTDSTYNIIYELKKYLNCSFSIFTNGSLRNEEYFKKLAELLNGPKDLLIFSVDGLENTNHLYRKNSNWNKIYNNMKSFIDNKGKARWDYIVFEHNEHQLNEAENLSKKLGFINFNPKYTKRHKPLEIKDKIVSCKYRKKDSIYIDSKNKLWPCTWYPGLNTNKNNNKVEEFKKLEKYNDFNNLEKYSMTEILNHEWYKTILIDSQENNINEICKFYCSSERGYQSFGKNRQGFY